MSRYYKIVVSDPATGELLVPNYQGQPGFSRVPSNPSIATYSSLRAGKNVSDIGGTNPAALLVEMDIPIAAQHLPNANSYVRVWGIGLQEIAQASNLNGLNCAVFGGMALGLPLSSPLQSGLLAAGTVYQAFGNWQGTAQTLDLYLTVGGSSPTSNVTTGVPSTFTTTPVASSNDQPSNLVFDWQPGQPLLTPLVNCLQTAYPKYPIRGAVSPNLVLTGAPCVGRFSTLRTLAKFINERSLSILGGYAPNQNYSGVMIVLQNNEIVISDGTSQTAPKQLAFQDLIGQPTWGQPGQVQVTTVMRGDIKPGDFVVLPPTLGAISSGSNSQFAPPLPQIGSQYNLLKRAPIFQSTFLVTALRHVGNSRAPTGEAWVTAFELLQVSATAQPVSSYPLLYRGNNSYTYALPAVGG